MLFTRSTKEEHPSTSSSFRNLGRDGDIYSRGGGGRGKKRLVDKGGEMEAAILTGLYPGGGSPFGGGRIFCTAYGPWKRGEISTTKSRLL